MAGNPVPSGSSYSISVVVCTCDRGESVIVTLRSILANTGVQLDLVVIDQSSENDTQRAIAALDPDPRLRYFRATERGLGRARNMGLANVQNDLVAMTDDDCEVPTTWLATLCKVMEAHPTVALAFCDVVAGPHDTGQGTIPAHQCSSDRLIGTPAQLRRIHFLGAGMVVRRGAIVEIGGFDPWLGAGGEFHAFEDVDIALRALLRGYGVYRTKETSVIHYGFRSWTAFRALLRRDFIGIGAGYAKLLKSGQWRVLPMMTSQFWGHVLRPALTEVARLRKPPVGVRVSSFMAGFLRGWKTPVDRRSLRYVLPEESQLGNTPDNAVEAMSDKAKDGTAI
jgi:GT2 family glycosyltransferase